MGRFRADEAENYGGTGGTGYFGLKNDKDIATVRFMYGSIEDVEGFAVHEVMVGDKKRYVNCLRSYSDPIDKCPFCAAKLPQKAKLFIPVYNVDDDRIQIWDRGRQFFSKMSSLCSRYPDLVSHTFEIERNGRAGSTQTTYEIFETGQDKTTLDDLPEVPDLLGSLVLNKTAAEMDAYLKDGQFPAEATEEIGRRRTEEPADMPVRRTPSNTSRRRETF